MNFLSTFELSLLKAQVLANRLENGFNDYKNHNFDQKYFDYVNNAVDNDEISKL